MAFLRREQVAAMGIHYIYYPLEYMLDAQRDAGFKTVEIWAASPHYLMDYKSCQEPAELKKKVEDRGMKIGSFCPECATYQYLMCGAGFPGFRERSMDYFKLGIECTARLGAEIMLTNCIGGTWDEEYEAVYERAVNNLRELARTAGDNGVTIAIETVRPEESRVIITLPELKRLLKDVGSPNVKAGLDTIAMGVANETLVQWFEELGSDIVHMHFVDGRPYGHLIWGDGLFSLDRFIETLNRYGYQGYLTQEITDGRYFDKPAEADKLNFKAFEAYFTDGKGAV
ncbi:protein FrlC [Ruminiclostridium sufflavum DSM 19573]|uniref:Protein FrlC n=1 Tax=Ruminiclostridium sufflavum DSM 19573 TaxID=1121337 RepID=A0A318XJK3_9FIRM|nr:sugar phosphate isomerase/epimerase family protein [Ruminiclostridium sufflavum]PYG85918.1 protein FrlC [Ruminiclostridium sufflavum DSM 19573]